MLYITHDILCIIIVLTISFNYFFSTSLYSDSIATKVRCEVEKLKLKKRRDELAMSLTAATRKKAALGVIKNVMEVRVIILLGSPLNVLHCY